MASALLADEDDPVGRAGDRAADVDQVTLRVDLLDPEVRLGVTLGAVVARHLLALDDARRVRAGSDGARATVLRVAVGVRAAAEAPALHHALEAASLGRPRDLHLVAGSEDPHRDLVAEVERRHFDVLPLRVVEAERAQHLRRRLQPRLQRVPDLGLVGATAARRALVAPAVLAAHALLAVAELHRRDARRLLGDDLRDRVRRGLHHRAGDLLPLRVEDLRHSDLLTDDA